MGAWQERWTSTRVSSVTARLVSALLLLSPRRPGLAPSPLLTRDSLARPLLHNTWLLLTSTDIGHLLVLTAQ